MMETIVILREYLNDRTIGDIYYCHNFMGKTLELPYQGNRPFVSCIPEGEYIATVENHSKFGWCLRFQRVLGRSGILLHVGNKIHETTGCILAGTSYLTKSEMLRSSRHFINLLINKIGPVGTKVKIRIYENMDSKSSKNHCD